MNSRSFLQKWLLLQDWIILVTMPSVHSGLYHVLHLEYLKIPSRNKETEQNIGTVFDSFQFVFKMKLWTQHLDSGSPHHSSQKAWYIFLFPFPLFYPWDFLFLPSLSEPAGGRLKQCPKILVIQFWGLHQTLFRFKEMVLEFIRCQYLDYPLFFYLPSPPFPHSIKSSLDLNS